MQLPWLNEICKVCMEEKKQTSFGIKKKNQTHLQIKKEQHTTCTRKISF